MATVLPVLILKNKNNKWLVRSGFQKAVRRGRLDEALKCGGYLYSEGVEYFWKALATIAVEDVGFGDLPSIQKILDVYYKADQALMTDLELIGQLIESLCLADKTRSFCELSLAVDCSLAKSDLAHYSNHLSEMLDAVVRPYEFPDNMETVVESYQILKAWFPKTSSAKTKEKYMGFYNELMGRLYKMGLDESLILSVGAGLLNPFDSMCYGILPMSLHYASPNRSAVSVVPTHSFEPEVQLKGVSSSAYDMHTSFGKMALKGFYTSLCKIPDFGAIRAIPESDAVKALGCAVFILEGGILDKRISSPFLDAVKNYQDAEFSKKYGIPPDFHADVLHIVQAELPRLQSKRAWVMSVQ